MAGVGTELKKLIPNVFSFKGCKCNNKARKYDSWGVAGCERRRAMIVAELMAQAKRNKMTRAAPTVLTKVVAERLVDTAIKRAKR